MRIIILSVIFSLIGLTEVSAQCSVVPVEEAVRNGDFEAGYLSGNGTVHTSVGGGDFDFYSDMDFKGSKFSGGGPDGCNCCNYGMGDGYSVARNDTFNCASTNFKGNTHWGVSYGGDKNFKDHTAGLDGEGYALLVDLNGRSVSPKTGGKPIAWEQTMSIYPSESYWFSAWVANFSNGTAPVMQVTVIPSLGGVPDLANQITLPTTGAPTGLMNWTQMSAAWTPVDIYDEVTIRFEFVNSTGGSGGLDVAIDDISFINSCQNIASQSVFSADFGLPDTVNICGTSGTVLLDPKVPVGQRGNATITWYEGFGNPQTQFSTGSWTETVDKLGKFRVCVDDPDNGCPVTDQVVIIDRLEAEIPDLDICDPTSVTLNATIDPTGGANVYAWTTLPSGVTDPGNSNSVLATEAGNYTVSVTGTSYNGGTCSATGDATITLNNTTTLNIPDFELCNPAVVAFDINNYLTTSGAFPKLYDWTVTGGPPDPGNTGSFVIDAAGSYSITITNTDATACIVTDAFVVTKNLPVTDTIDYCNGGDVDVTLSIPGAKTYTWAKDQGMTDIIGTGNGAPLSYTVPTGSTGFIDLWVQDAATSPLGSGGPATGSLSGYPAGFYTMTFTVTQTVELTSFQVKGKTWLNNCAGSGVGNQTFTISGSINDVYAQDVSCAGTTTITPRWLLGPGTYTITSNGKYQFTNTTTNTSIGGGVVDITSTGKAMFGNLTFATSSACVPVSVVLRPMSCCTAPTDDPSINIIASTLEVCEPNEGEVVSVSGLTNGLDYQWQESVDGLAWSDIAAETGDVAGGSITLSNRTTEQWYRFVIAEDGNLGKTCVRYSDSVQFIINSLPVIDSIGLSPFQSSYCAGIDHILETHVDPNGGYPVTYLWKKEGIGTDSVTDGITTAGTHDYKVVVDSKGCLDSMEISIVVDPLDSSKINTGQGPFCINEIDPIINYDNGTTPGGTWSVLPNTNGTINSATGELAMLDSGLVRVVYTTSGNCPGVDTVIIEIKPLMVVDFATADSSFCKADVSFQLRLTGASSSGGTWSCKENNGAINGSGLFDATDLSAGDYVVKYAMSGFNTACSDSDSVRVTILPLDTAAISTAPSVCSTDLNFNLSLDGGSTLGGVWTDSLGANTYVTTSGNFDPNGLPKGLIKVYYTTPGNCSYTDSAYVRVTDNISYTMLSIKEDYCMNGSIDTIEVDILGGEFWTTSGNGIIDAAKGFYDPSLALTSGIDTIWYGKTGDCGDTVFIAINLIDIDLAKINPEALSCDDWSPIQFTVDGTSTPGGTWSGTGIDGFGLFDPSTAVDSNMIYYTTPGVCPVIDSVLMLVLPRLNVAIDSLVLPFCGVASPLSATVNLSGGTWEGSNTWNWNTAMTYNNDSTVMTFDPNGQTPGIDSVFYMIGSACGDTAKLIVGISPMEVANIIPEALSCSDWASIQFTIDGASTSNGTWSGSPAIDASGLFDPSAAVDTNMIYYKTPGVCFVIDTVMMLVSPRVDVSIDKSILAFCGNAASDIATVDLSGGIWEGSNTWNWNTAMTFNNDSTVMTFDPNGQVAGIDSIYYMIGTTCGDTATLRIGISAVDTADIDTNNAGPYCATQSPEQLLLNPSTNNGVWSGGAWITASGIFDPGSATISSDNRVIYTTQGVCPIADTFNITVVGQIIVDLEDDIVQICNDQSNIDLVALLKPITSATNGPWTANPLTAGVISGSEFVVTSATPGDYTVKYVLGAPGATCADSDSVVIRVLPVLDPTIDAGPVDDICISTSTYQFVNTGDNGGTWIIDGTGVIDGVSGEMDLTASGIGTFTIKYGFSGMNICPIDSPTTITVVGPEDPTIQDVDAMCEDGSTLFVLATGTQGGTWSSDGTGIDAVTGEFNPTTAGAGDHIITYSLTGICPIDSSITVVVLPVKNPTIGNIPSGNVCISDGPYQFTNTGDAGGTWSIEGSGVIDAITGSVDLIGSGIGTFKVYYAFGGACAIKDSSSITIVGPGDPKISPVDSICENEGVITLVSAGGNLGTWSGVGVNPVTGVFDPIISEEGTHKIKYTISGTCPISDSIYIVVKDVPEIILTPDFTEACAPAVISITDPTSAEVDVSHWTFDEPIMNGIYTEIGVLTKTYLTPGFYSPTIINRRKDGCRDTAYFPNLFEVKKVPVPDFTWSPSKPTVLDPIVEFTDKTDETESWNWTFERGNPGSSVYGNPLTIFPNSDTGTYTVCLAVDLRECLDTICKEVEIFDNFSVYIPNAFTPDGDGLNDVFLPKGKGHDNAEGLGQYEFLIFNRWGGLIWESNKPYQTWDGTDQKSGNIVQQDVYVWKLNVYDNIDGVLKSYYGHISVVK